MGSQAARTTRLQQSCRKVKGIGNGYWRVVAEVEDLLDLAAQFKQRTLYGIGFARQLIGA